MLDFDEIVRAHQGRGKWNLPSESALFLQRIPRNPQNTAPAGGFRPIVTPLLALQLKFLLIRIQLVEMR